MSERRSREGSLRVSRSRRLPAGWLQHTYPDVERMQMSHATIYLSLFIQACGGLKHRTVT